MGITEDVARGIKLLNRVAPPNWRDKINTVTLDLGSKDLCILAQIYGSYDEAKPIWREIIKAEAWKYGFYIRTTDLKVLGLKELGVIDERYKELREAWLQELNT